MLPFLLKNSGGEIMRLRLIILSLVVISVCGFCLTQTEISVLKYQLQMPSIIGNAVGFRMMGNMEDGAFGLVWRVDNRIGLFTGQVLGFNSVFSEWLETGVFQWDRVYFDIFLLLRF